MKEYDRVKLLVEKDCYAKEGVHKDMTGWVCDPNTISGTWLICFDEEKYFHKFPVLSVAEADLKVIYSFDPQDVEQFDTP